MMKKRFLNGITIATAALAILFSILTGMGTAGSAYAKNDSKEIIEEYYAGNGYVFVIVDDDLVLLCHKRNYAESMVQLFTRDSQPMTKEDIIEIINKYDE